MVSTVTRQALRGGDAGGTRDAQALSPSQYASFTSPYIVRLEGKGDSITVRDRMEVSQAMLAMLEKALGKPDKVIACFRAWQRQKERGCDWMSKTERTNARTWQLAFDHSAGTASEMLSRPGTARFVFELRESFGH